MTQRQREQAVEAWQASGVDDRHAKTDRESLFKHELWSQTFSDMKPVLAAGGFVVFLGDRGTGKTQMAVELIRHYCQAVFASMPDTPPGSMMGAALYVRAREIGMMTREAFGKTNTMTERQAVNQFIKPKLLVVDECQERHDSEWESRNMTLILDKRYASKKPTILIANATFAKFARFMGASVTDRIKEDGQVVLFNWPSFRGVGNGS